MHPLSKKLKQPSSSSSSFFSPSSLFLYIICFAALFLSISLFRTSPSSAQHSRSTNREASFSPSCNVSDGRWIYDRSIKSPRYDNSCKEIYKGWNCIGSSKSNALDIVKWRWKPYGCDLPQFDALRFLDRFRNTNIGTFLIFELVCLC